MAFDTKLYSAFATGSDLNDGLTPATAFKTFAPSKALIEAGVTEQYEHIFLEDTTENCTLNISTFQIAVEKLICKITFANSIKATGTGDFFTVSSSAGVKSGIWANGWSMESYDYGCRATGTFTSYCKFTNCNMDSQVAMGRPYTISHQDSEYKDMILRGASNLASNDFKFNSVINCTLDNVGDLTQPFFMYPALVSHTEYGILRNSFKNMNIGIFIDDGSPTYKNLQYNNFENCSFFLFDATHLTPVTYTACNSIVELDALYLTTFGASSGGQFNDNTFNTISVDQFNYPTSKTESEILKRHIGANRYAITQTVPVANADYTDVAGVYESNTLTPTPLVYELEVPRAGFARTATLHFTRSGSTEQLGTNGQVEILIKYSADGTNFTTLGTFLSGIDSGTLDFDFLNTPAKAIRASIQPVGAAFGELQLEGITVDFNTLEDRLSQTDTRTLYTAGNIPTNVSELYNRAIHDPVANFTQELEANQLMLSPSGGLESVDENGIMNATFEGDSVFTELTYAYWIYIPSDFIPINDHYTCGNWNAAVAPNALGITLGLRNITSQLGWRVIAANTDYTILNYDLIPTSQFLAKYAGKFRHVAATFKSGVVRLYIDAINVFTYTNTQSTVKFPADGIFSLHGTNNQAGKSFTEGFKTDSHYLSLTKAYTSDEIAELRATDQFNNSHLR